MGCSKPYFYREVGKFAPISVILIQLQNEKKSFALMHPDFESNLITHILGSLGSAGQPEVTSFLPLSEAPKEFHAVLSTMHAYQCAYSIHCIAYSLSMLIFS